MTGEIRIWTRRYRIKRYSRTTSSNDKNKFFETNIGLISKKLKFYEPLNNFEIISGMPGLLEGMCNGVRHVVEVNGVRFEIAASFSGIMRAYKVGDRWTYFGSKVVTNKFDGKGKIKDWVQLSGAQWISCQKCIL